MGDEQKLTPEEQIRTAREAFENTEDFTVAVEEEFAILDPETLGLANRFEELQAAAVGTELEPHLVGELIASEIEIRTGELRRLHRPLLGWASGATSSWPSRTRWVSSSAGPARITRPLAGAADHRHAPLPAQRRGPPPCRVAQQQLPGLPRARRDQGARPRDAGARLAAAPAPGDPCALRQLAVPRERLHAPALDADRDLLRSSSPLRDPRRVRRLADVRALRARALAGSITRHTQLWWSVRPHLAFPTVEIRIADAQPELGEARSLAAFAYALTVRIARALDDGEPVPLPPRRFIEENFWRATRYGLTGELLDLDRLENVNTREQLERLISGSALSRTRSAPLHSSPFRPQMPRSARSRAMKRAPRSRRSTPSRCGRKSRLSIRSSRRPTSCWRPSAR